MEIILIPERDRSRLQHYVDYCFVDGLEECIKFQVRKMIVAALGNPPKESQLSDSTFWQGGYEDLLEGDIVVYYDPDCMFKYHNLKYRSIGQMLESWCRIEPAVYVKCDKCGKEEIINQEKWQKRLGLWCDECKGTWYKAQSPEDSAEKESMVEALPLAVIMKNKEIGQRIYKVLETLDLDTNGEVGRWLYKKGYWNLTVCPLCRVDDFVHVENCELADK